MVPCHPYQPAQLDAPSFLPRRGVCRPLHDTPRSGLSRSVATCPECPHPLTGLRALPLCTAEVAGRWRPFPLEADDGEAFAAVRAPHPALFHVPFSPCYAVVG